MSGPPEISVVLAVRNMASTIESQLAALSRQDFDGDWELIVADNASTDDTLAVVERWSARLPLRILAAGGPPDTSRGRNVGAAGARAPRLAFCDGDDEVSPGWLRAIAEALRDAALVIGPLDYQRLNSPQAAAVLESGAPGTSAWHLESEGIGGNCGVRREAFEAVGGFPEDYGRGQDTAFFWRAQLAGHRLALEPRAIVHYRLKGDSRRAMFQRFYRHGRASVKHYQRFREHGLPRSPARDVVYDWATVPLQLLRGNSYRAAQQAGWRLGRLVGSASSSVLCL